MKSLMFGCALLVAMVGAASAAPMTHKHGPMMHKSMSMHHHHGMKPMHHRRHKSAMMHRGMSKRHGM